jgi:phage/plasmid-like protein (TIGR03299 family)
VPDQVDQMFSVREMPWHRKGHVPDDYPQNFREARKLAGLYWDPVAVPAASRLMPVSALREEFTTIVENSPMTSVTETVDLLAALYERSLTPDREFRRIARSDDMRQTLSYQRNSYNLIPNSAFGEIIDSILNAEPDTVKLETGGCLAQGRKVWMLARLDEPIELPGDGSVTFPFLGITSSHDGKASCAARLTTVRIVCANTFGAAEAEGERTGAVFSFSHRGDWRSRLGEAREALNFARREARVYVEAMTELLGIAITPRQEQLFLQQFIPSPPDGIVSDRVAKNITEARMAVLGFLESPTVEGAGIRGTAYALVQGAGEYLDHARAARSWETRMNRSLLRIEPMKAKAAVLARQVAMDRG